MTGWNTTITIELYGGRVEKPPGIRWERETRPCPSKQRVNGKEIQDTNKGGKQYKIQTDQATEPVYKGRKALL